VGLPRKTAKAVAEVFLDRVLARFGGCGEVLTDGGTEFRGEFDALLRQVGATHRVVSRNCPQGNGLAERLVGTLKRALRKYCIQYDARDWDLQLPWIALGYRCTRQAALHEFSPYFLLYGRTPGSPRQQLSSRRT